VIKVKEEVVRAGSQDCLVPVRGPGRGPHQNQELLLMTLPSCEQACLSMMMMMMDEDEEVLVVVLRFGRVATV
jgi:hypothetical protein